MQIHMQEIITTGITETQQNLYRDIGSLEMLCGPERLKTYLIWTKGSLDQEWTYDGNILHALSKALIRVA